MTTLYVFSIPGREKQREAVAAQMIEDFMQFGTPGMDGAFVFPQRYDGKQIMFDVMYGSCHHVLNQGKLYGVHETIGSKHNKVFSSPATRLDAMTEHMGFGIVPFLSDRESFELIRLLAPREHIDRSAPFHTLETVEGRGGRVPLIQDGMRIARRS